MKNLRGGAVAEDDEILEAVVVEVREDAGNRVIQPFEAGLLRHVDEFRLAGRLGDIVQQNRADSVREE